MIFPSGCKLIEDVPHHHQTPRYFSMYNLALIVRRIEKKTEL